MGRVVAIAFALVACGRIGIEPTSRPDARGCGPSIDLTTDPLNCGTCGHDCLGGSCAAGTCMPVQLATNQGALRQILVDGSFAYWAGPAAIKRIATSGGAPETVATFVGTGFRMIEFGGYLYWVTRDTGLVARASIVPGSTTETIATNQGDVGGIVTDGAIVYWDTYPTAGMIFRKPLGSAVRSDLLAIPTDGLTGMRLVDGSLYYLREGLGLFRIPAAGGSPETVVPQVGTFELAVDGDDVFVASTAADKIVRVSRTTGDRADVADAKGPWGIAVDVTHVYYANEAGDTIARAPRGGGPAETLAIAVTPVGIAVDDRAVYWTTRGGDVMMIAK